MYFIRPLPSPLGAAGRHRARRDGAGGGGREDRRSVMPAAASHEVPRPTPLPLRVESIPELLRALLRWVMWIYVWRQENGKPGKWTKPPFVATAPAQPADSTDPTTWRSFADALGAYED